MMMMPLMIMVVFVPVMRLVFATAWLDFLMFVMVMVVGTMMLRFAAFVLMASIAFGNGCMRSNMHLILLRTRAHDAWEGICGAHRQTTARVAHGCVYFRASLRGFDAICELARRAGSHLHPGRAVARRARD